MKAKRGIEEILVCIGRETWNNPDVVRNAPKFYCVSNGIVCSSTIVEGTPLNRVASDVIFYGFSEGTKLVRKPYEDSETFYGDGYFGRPLVPCSVVKYTPMKKKDFQKLENIVRKMLNKKE